MDKGRKKERKQDFLGANASIRRREQWRADADGTSTFFPSNARFNNARWRNVADDAYELREP